MHRSLHFFAVFSYSDLRHVKGGHRIKWLDLCGDWMSLYNESVPQFSFKYSRPDPTLSGHIIRNTTGFSLRRCTYTVGISNKVANYCRPKVDETNKLGSQLLILLMNEKCLSLFYLDLTRGVKTFAQDWIQAALQRVIPKHIQVCVMYPTDLMERAAVVLSRAPGLAARLSVPTELLVRTPGAAHQAQQGQAHRQPQHLHRRGGGDNFKKHANEF